MMQSTGNLLTCESPTIALRRPEWRVLVDALQAYVGSGPGLNDDERRVVRAVLKLHK
jgi:hypothetical protein